MAGSVALAACKSTSPGNATPAGTSAGTTSVTTTASNTSPQLPSDGAPKVDNPMDAAKFREQPCLALTQQQATQLNVGFPGKQRQGPLGQVCDWETPQDSGLIDLQWSDKNPRGLSAEYKANKDGKWAYFKELPPIEGFPAIAADATDGRQRGECTVAVGVSDQYSFALGLVQSRSKVGTADPCDVAVQVAGMVLTTMKAGG
jgi:hypothetical protein